MNASRPGRIVFVAVFVSLFGILFLAKTLYFKTVHVVSGGEKHASLSLLVPATSSNVNLCRLVLSATILRYPVPVLINWAAPENKEYEFAQHIVKVDTILNYLNVLFDRGKENDLVLIVDGYDVQFQLPPDVLVQRYFKVNEAANKRIERQVGRGAMARYGLKQSVIFGMDKMCWPDDPRFPQRSGCWAVPDSSAPKYAFGPQTDSIDSMKMRARWLNSGSVMGPVGDVKKVFEATLESIHKNRTTDSDQFYFANIFGEQEWSRRLLEKDPMRGLDTKRSLEMPNFVKGQKTEYHIGIDYEGALFQVCGFFRSYLTWMKFDGEPKHHAKPNPWEHLLASDDYWDKVLPDDVAGSRAPFSAFSGTDVQVFLGTGTEETRLATNLTWRDVPLGLNSISPHIFPILHFTGPKYWRETWWTRMWFFPNVEALLKASARPIFGPIASKNIAGSFWWNEGLPANGVMPGDKGGAVGDKGNILPWESLCGMYEAELFTSILPPKKEV